MATDIIARGMITEYKSGTNISFKENDDGSVTISASGDVSSEDTVARDTIDNHKLDKNNPHNVTAEQVGLGNVNNTADLDKPISTAVQTALDDKANTKHTHNKSDITDFPNSLPANGGNADTVDGFDVAEYVTTLPEGEYYTEVARINTRGKKIESFDTSNLKVGLAEEANYATNAMNSDTVNNHTVDSDVPANAVFTDTTNSDVTIVGNPVQIDGLQGGVPFSEMVVSGDNIIGQKLTVNVCGKNLLPYPYDETTKTVNGITFTDNGDGTITVDGTASSDAVFYFANKKEIIQSGNSFYLSGCPVGGSGSSYDIVFATFDENNTTINVYNDVGNGKHITVSGNAKTASVYIRIRSGQTISNLIFRPQLELISMITFTPDSNLYTVPNDIRQQDGLNIVSVSEGELSVIGVRKNAAIGKLYTDLKTVAFSGSYNDLGDKPEIPINSDVMASGNPVQIDGLQGGVPFSEIAVSGKNLIPYPYVSTTKTINGITFTDNGDGTITVNGTAVYDAAYDLSNFTYKKGIDYILSGCPNGGSNSTYKLKGFKDGVKDDIGNATLIRVENDVTATLCILVYKGYTVENLVFRPQLELGDTATAYEPPITGRELTVNVSGKNLMKYPYYNTTQTQNGVTFTDNGDGSITVNGTATATAYFSLSSNKALPTGKYVLGKSMDNILLYVDKYLDNAFYQRLANSTETIKELIFNVSEEDAQKYTYKFGIQINKGNTEDNVTIYPQLELGSTATAYEPYHGAEYTITPTSNPYVIPNDIRQVDGRNIVSVSEGELSVVGVQKNAAVKKIWDEMGMDLLFDGTVTTGTNCITDNVNGYNFLYFYGNLSSVSGTSGNVTGSLVVPKTARAISAGQSLVVTTGVTYITVNIINIESGVITFTVTPNDSSREIYEFKIYGIK